MEEKQYNTYKLFEWFGVVTAIMYSLFVALNVGLEFFGHIREHAFDLTIEYR